MTFLGKPNQKIYEEIIKRHQTPTFHNIKFVTDYRNPNVVNDISVFTEIQPYTDIKINGDGKDILSGSMISYRIQISQERPVPVIYQINGQDVTVKQSYESTDFSLSGDTVISVGIRDF